MSHDITLYCDEALEFEALALALRMTYPQKILMSLSSDDFYVKEAKYIFTLISQLLEIDPKFDVSRLYDDEGIDFEIFNMIMNTSVRHNVLEVIKLLKDKTLSRKIALFSKDCTTLDQEENIGRQYSFLLEKFKTLGEGVPLVVKSIFDITKEELEFHHYGIFPYQDLSEIHFGQGYLGIVGARPGVGKSTFMLNLAIKLKPQKARIFTLEMSWPELTSKLLSIEGVNFDNREALDHISCVENVNNIEKLQYQIKRANKEEGIRLFFVDYIQLLKSNRRYESRHLEVASLTRDLKLLAQELQICIVCLAQVNRDADGRVPRASDLRESGSIEQDADFIILLHQQEDNPILLETIVAKNRHGKANYKTNLYFDKQTGRISDVSREHSTSYYNQPKGISS